MVAIKLEKILLENILLIAAILLVVGIILLLFEPTEFIGQLLISGGFFGILVYLIVGRHEKYWLTKTLGVDEGESLVRVLKKLYLSSGEIYLQEEPYILKKWSLEWKFLDVKKNKEYYAARFNEQRDLVIGEKELRGITFCRDANVSLQDMKKSVEIKYNDKSICSDEKDIPETSESSDYVKIFEIRYPFKKRNGYTVCIDVTQPPWLKKDRDTITVGSAPVRALETSNLFNIVW